VIDFHTYNGAMVDVDSRALIDEGMAHHRAGRAPAAEKLYRQVLDRDPGNAEAHHLIGVLRFQEGKPQQAVVAFQHALAAGPENPKMLANLAAALLVLGRVEPAIEAFERAVVTAPETPELLKNLGTAYRQVNRLEDAAFVSERSVAFFPDDATAHANLAAVQLALGRHEDALASAEKAVALNPEDPDALNTLGSALIVCRRLDDAIEALERAVKSAPDLVEASRNLALALQEACRYEEAATQYEVVIEKWPEDASAHAGLGRTRRLQGRLADAIVACREAVALNPSSSNYLSNLLFCLIGSPDQDGYSLKAEHLRWADRFAPSARRREFSNSRDPDRRLRIGFVSPDFRDHPVGRIVGPVFATYDSEAVEIICYSNSVSLDQRGAAIAETVDQFVPVIGLSDKDVAGRIIEDRIDVLVDLAGHTARSRLGVFALKPAPVQASWLGYMATTGLSAIDYVVGDPVHTPESFDGHFVEKVARLPRDLACFVAPDTAIAVAPLPAVQTGRITFGAFNNPGKMNERVIALWASILNDVTGSALLMRYAGCEDAAVQRDFTDRFAAQGIAPARLSFEGSGNYENVLRAYNRVDIALDTFPYSGTMTTMEALWMGVPVVALAGDRMTARQSVAHLTAAGLADLVASDTDGYRRIAVDLAADPDRLSALRTAMRERLLASELMDATGLARALEGAWRSMWQRWCATPRG
jgi:protein O-GlcNAc transferase